jgi:hypothetical protein
MDNETIDRARKIIYDQPRITRAQLKLALGISDASVGRCIATLRHVQKNIIKVGTGYVCVDPDGVRICPPYLQEGVRICPVSEWHTGSESAPFS